MAGKHEKHVANHDPDYENRIRLAIKDLGDGIYQTISSAAKAHQIARQTLSDRVNGVHQSRRHARMKRTDGLAPGQYNLGHDVPLPSRDGSETWDEEKEAELSRALEAKIQALMEAHEVNLAKIDAARARCTILWHENDILRQRLAKLEEDEN